MCFIYETVIEEWQHGLTGHGVARYRYNPHYSEVHTKLGDGEWKVFTGEKAKEILINVMSGDSDSQVNKVKQIASDICGIPLIRMYEKTRDEEVVFARYLVMWYCMFFENMKETPAADLFNLKRLTAKHANKVIDKDAKYFKTKQSIWRRKFILTLRTSLIIKPEQFKQIKFEL